MGVSAQRAAAGEVVEGQRDFARNWQALSGSRSDWLVCERGRASGRLVAWSVMELQQLIGTQRQRSVCLSVIVGELDLVDTGCEPLDDCAHLAAPKWKTNHILEQGHN
jgi:hypothetical protein